MVDTRRAFRTFLSDTTEIFFPEWYRHTRDTLPFGPRKSSRHLYSVF